VPGTSTSTTTNPPPTSATTTTAPPTTSPPPPPPNDPPKIEWAPRGDPGANGEQIAQQDLKELCVSQFPTLLFPIVIVNDDEDPPNLLQVTVQWDGFAKGQADMTWDPGNGINYFYGTIGPIVNPTSEPNGGGTPNVWVTAVDTKGKQSRLDGTKVQVRPCPDRIIPG